ncbi:MAG: isomerase [Desulfobulbus sp.]|nr:MAG: isomerase [Desulfobulbus sp.]
MDIPYYHVDAFTGSLFRGNPAGVCLLQSWLPDDLLLAIAHENRLSETAFLVGKKGKYELRWFTPATEVDLCGHATLAASFVLYTFTDCGPGPLIFHSQSGELSVSRADDMLFLNFPSRKAEEIPCPDLLTRALGRKPVAVYAERDVMAVFESPEHVRMLTPDFSLLKGLEFLGCIVTAPGAKEDFVSRFFAPSVGIDEDPVTGSAHCTLIPYWSERLNKTTLLARQISSRGGELLCCDEGDRVSIGGRATLYLSGSLHLRE